MPKDNKINLIKISHVVINIGVGKSGEPLEKAKTIIACDGAADTLMNHNFIQNNGGIISNIVIIPNIVIHSGFG